MTQRTILLIRHGESTFNAAAAGGLTRDPLLFDAPLTARGRDQASAAAATMRERPVDVVVVSPLTRALQTAQAIFGDHPSRPTLSVEVGHRERLESSCDKGRSPGELALAFPSLSFGHLPDTWWHDAGEPNDAGIRVEPLDVMLARLKDFATALAARPERHIVVVGHATFFHHLTGRWLSNCEILPWDGEVSGVETA